MHHVRTGYFSKNQHDVHLCIVNTGLGIFGARLSNPIDSKVFIEKFLETPRIKISMRCLNIWTMELNKGNTRLRDEMSFMWVQRLINLEIPVLVRSLKSSNIELG